MNPELVGALDDAAQSTEGFSDGPSRAMVRLLVSDYRKVVDLSEHRLKLLDEAWRREASLYLNEEVLTRVEAHQFLQDGTLPENFTERLRFFIDHYKCRNCDGREDMNVVFRAWFDDEPSWCPDCVIEGRPRAEDGE